MRNDSIEEEVIATVVICTESLTCVELRTIQNEIGDKPRTAATWPLITHNCHSVKVSLLPFESDKSSSQEELDQVELGAKL